MPVTGEITPAGDVLFFGHFYPIAEDIRESRLKTFNGLIEKSPATGAGAPVVTVIEFSDFECPSCQHASGYMPKILTKYGDKVRYVRYDLPLISMHPWSFEAAIAGRAIYRQKPDLFWMYKKDIYENQDKITAFTVDEFARGFAQQHELDLKKYDADVADDALHNEILKGIGVAFSNDIRATPTYVVNGHLVDAGAEGKGLEDYIASLAK
jgi:protein-disulfide isomerase